MDTEKTGLVRRARTHAALADVTRLRIVDHLSTSDASTSEMSGAEITPVYLADAMQEDDFLVTVCDRAHEELADRIHTLAPRWVR